MHPGKFDEPESDVGTPDGQPESHRSGMNDVLFSKSAASDTIIVENVDLKDTSASFRQRTDFIANLE